MSRGDVSSGDSQQEGSGQPIQLLAPSDETPNQQAHQPQHLQQQHRRSCRLDRVWIFALAIVAVGLAVSITFLMIGLDGARQQESNEFERNAQELVSSIETAWDDYDVAALFIYNDCRGDSDSSTNYLERGICTRQQFDDLYDNVLYSGLDVQAISMVINATHQDRLALEAESYAYYADKNWSNFEYNGFIEFQPDPDSPRGVSVVSSPVADYYYVPHYVAPYTGFNLNALDFNIRTSAPRRTAFENALNTQKPALTDRVVLLGDAAEIDGYSVILMHPGIPSQDKPPNEASFVVVRMRSLLLRSVGAQTRRASVFLYDVTNVDEDAKFLGALAMMNRDTQESDFLPEVDLETARIRGGLIWDDTLSIADRQWVIVVTQDEDPEIVFIVIAASIIILACMCLALWYFTSARHEARMNALRAASEAEKAALVLENAENAAKHERDLNDFVAHEVRNPLAAALSAFTFVESEIREDPPLSTDVKVISVREDLSVIGSSLKYINDLLRNMLDMHKIASNELHVQLSPTDLQHDVLDTVQGMLYNRGDNVKVEVLCPENLAVMTDRIRLKQIILNLTNNSRKFVTQGFIRVRVAIVDEKVTIYVEDSGPGIPESKRKKLWNKYQESLDALNQGTGIGLSLCKDLIHLMNGNIWLDSQYDSGVPGSPGARFVVDLNACPLDLTKVDYHRYDESERNVQTLSLLPYLPAKMCVLFVDDDLILRKLFGRSVKRILPQWKIHEAASGEKAVEMAKTQNFDLIFVDHYMASIEKQMLGTETVRALRANGIESVICGLSANNVEESFLEAGSNHFMFKPFPCEKNELAQELVRILKGTKYLVTTKDI